MSHELRTPLNAVIGYAQLLEMGELDEPQRRSVHQIAKAGRQLLQLVDEALEIVRVESGELTLSLEPVEVIALVDAVLDLVRPLAKERRVELLVAPDGEVARVMADEPRLKVVLLNLLSNAVSYNREGGRVEIAVSETAGRVRLSVADTGPGLDAEQLTRLFMPFERLGAEQRGIEGTGLGLTLAKRLTEAMGGTIGVESKPGEGSTFWIELEKASGGGRQSRPVGKRVQPASGPAATKTVLYVEDNVVNVELVAELLASRPGITLMNSMQGRLGIELARQHRPSLIILDLNLPDTSGQEVLAELKADESTRAIPVVVLSSDAFPDQPRRLLEAGASAYLTKPLDLQAFLDLLDRTLT